MGAGDEFKAKGSLITWCLKQLAVSNTTAKLRIKQYFQVQDYALWEVIENCNSWVSVPQTAQENGTSVTKMSVLVTAKEKTNKKNDVKARSLLLMALPNEHQLTSSQYSDAKIMFAAIETRFRGNEATKKTQKTLLKQQYEIFSASSTESLDSIFNRLQKIVTRLAILVWMNTADIETMSIDDLYNNFKIIEQYVKKSVGASNGAQNLAFMTAPSTSSTNDVNTTNPAYEVSTVSPNISIACPQVSTANFSDNIVYAFMVENPNGSNLPQQDLEQIHEDDMEVMDLKWQLSLLSMRVKRECKAPKNKEGQFRYQDNTRKQGNNEDISSKAMLAIDGVGFDWSDMAEEQVQTNMALMAFSDSKLNQTEFTSTTYKIGLATVEEKLVTYRKNEVLLSEEVAVLKREVACKDYEINVLKSEFEKVKQEKEGIEFKIEKFDNASKSLDKLLGSQITDKSKKGLGYNVVPPPHPLIYNRPKKLDLSYSGLDEFKDPEFKSYGSEDSKQESNIVCDKKSDDSKENSNDSLVKEQVSEDTSSFVESSLNVEKETIFLDKKIEFIKPKNHEKPVKKSVRVNYNYTTNRFHSNAQRNMVPRAVLMKTGLKPFNTTRTVNTAHPKSTVFSANPMLHFSKLAHSTGKPLIDDKGFVDSACSRHMIGNIAYLSYFNFDMKNIVPKKSLTCLVTKATLDESMLWHMRLGHINFKNINKLVKDNLVRGKFDGKSDEGFFVGYSLSSKAFRVYNIRTSRVEENLHIGFLENKPMIERNGPKWLFDIDSLTQSMNYVPVAAGTISNESAGTQGDLNAGTSTQKEEISQECIVMLIWKDASYFDSPSKDVDKSKDDSSPKEVNAAGQYVNTASPEVNTANHTLEATHVEFFSDEDKPDVDLGNITNSYIVPTTPNTRIYKDHPIKNVISDVKSSIQTRRLTKSTSEQGFLIAWKQCKKNFCNSSSNRNKARLVAQGHRQEEGIDYEEVFVPVARIEAIRLFLAYSSFMGFLVYQMDVKSALLYVTIEEEVYVTQSPGFKDPDHPDKVYKVVKALYGLHQALRAWYETLANYLLGNEFKREKIDQTLFIKKQKGDIYFR
ncbi:putative ribonuclease H-like domain-containing protein [Tanacetum coccineum]